MQRRAFSLLPIGWALRESLRQGYHWQDFKADLGAAFVVSLIALPLSMALAIAVGLSPEHGIYTAIVAGIAAALLGGSQFQISGPTAAFVVILIPIVADLGLRGIIWCQIIAGIILIILGYAKIGQWIHRVPMTVTIGFTTGIAIVLATLALKDFLGLKLASNTPHFIDKVCHLATHLSDVSWPETIVGIVTLLLIVTARKWIKIIPAPMTGVIVGAILAIVFDGLGYPLATIGSEFSYQAQNGSLQMGIPPFAPALHLPTLSPGSLFTVPNLTELKALLPPALIIAALIALESLLSAAIADSLTQTKHQPNAELKGIGLANILSGLATGIPATAAIARTAANIHNGARTPFASMFHSVLILIYVLIFSPIICLIPMTSLAALLLVTAYHMSHLKQFLNMLRYDMTSNRIVLVSCCLVTVFVDMVAGISVGIALAWSLQYINRFGLGRTT